MQTALLIIDTETTGIDTSKDRPCQVGALLMVEKEPGHYKTRRLLNTYCIPGVEMSQAAMDIHGIGPDKYRWAVKDTQAIDQLQDIVERLEHQFGTENLIIGGHNHEHYDNPLIETIAKRQFLSDKMQIDTYNLAIRSAPPGTQKCGLFYEFLTGNKPVDAHDAMADITMVSEIIDFNGKTRLTDLKQLAHWLSVPTLLNVWPWGENEKGKHPTEVSPNFVKWLKGKNKDGMPRDVRYTFEAMLHYQVEKVWPPKMTAR